MLFLFKPNLDTEINNNNKNINAKPAQSNPNHKSGASRKSSGSSIRKSEEGAESKAQLIDNDNELINLSFLRRSTRLNREVDTDQIESNSFLTNIFAQMNTDNFNLIPDAKQLQMAVLGE